MDNAEILVGNDQLVPIESGVILNQRINHRAVGGKIGNHVWFADDELSVHDVVVGVVTAVDNEWVVHHKTGGVALSVGAGVGFVGWHTVEGEKLVVGIAEDDDATACAFNVCCDVNPVEKVAQGMIIPGRWVVIMCRVWVYRDGIRQDRPIRVFGILLATVKEGQEYY